MKRHSILDYVRAGLFFSVYGCFKYFPTPIGDLLRFLVLKVFMRRLNTCYIRDGATFLFQEKISIGKGTCINEFVWMDGSGEIEIGKDVLIAPGVYIVSFNHGFGDKDRRIIDQEKELGKIVIEDDVWLGAGSKILKGVTIGRGAIVGAGSIVTKDLPAYSISLGSPAKVTGKR